MSANSSSVLGIDLGAGSLKATLVDTTDGRVLGEASHPVTTRIPQHGWSEQNPEEWYAALCRAVPQALAAARLPADRIAAIGVSAGAHIPVLLDASGAVLRPAIMWNDQRSAAEAAELREQHGELIERLSLNRANPTWSLPMLCWLQRHEPEVIRKAHHFCLPKDYLRWRLTDTWNTDFSDVIGALMADARRREWSPEICALIDWPTATLPPVCEPTAIAGGISPQAARDTGLAVDTPVVIGSNDTTVELFGVGAVEPGQAAIKLATAGVLFLTVDRPIVKPPISCYPHIVDGFYYLATGTNACASAHRWAGRQLFPDLDFDALNRLAASAPPGSDGLFFHPYLQGERGPHWDPLLRAGFWGLTLQHGRAHLARAVYEGIAYSINDLLRDARAKGLEIGNARLLGGGVRSAEWRQLMADVTGLSLELPETGEASFGAALVAGIGIGLLADPQEAVRRCVRIVETAEPDPQRHALYQELFGIYQALQQAQAPIAHRLHALLQS